MSEVFDFPFRKGIPIGSMNDQGDAQRASRSAISAARNFSRAALLLGERVATRALRQGARGIKGGAIDGMPTLCRGRTGGSGRGWRFLSNS